jgi:hypothetical protein
MSIPLLLCFFNKYISAKKTKKEAVHYQINLIYGQLSFNFLKILDLLKQVGHNTNFLNKIYIF